ncbi:MAG: biotin--[acetyl-CoA-carboxylase] ligase [Mariniphaga sp.]|nr:biotin--[acetyl-CoA-carboxylase] ligase [Mariniphaga sp.]
MKIKNIINLSAVESTNNYARGLIVHKESEEGTVVLAKHQTNGRGTDKNYWESEKGKNLTFSILFAPFFLNPAKQFYLSMVVSLGVFDTISSEVDRVKIKWPNDIYIQNKKVAGILIENTIQGNEIAETIAGIGININQHDFISDAPNPVSLKNVTGNDYNLDFILEKTWNNIMGWYDRLKEGDEKTINETYISRLFWLNELAQYKNRGEIFSGKIIGVDEFGRLKIEKQNREVPVFQFKEVEYIFTDTEVL